MGTLIYRAGKADEQRWDWDPADPDAIIGYEVETVTDWPWQVFLGKYRLGSHLAMQALVYAFMKRDNDRLKLASVQVKYSDLDYEPDADELPDEADEADEPEPEPKGKTKGKSKGKTGDQGEA